MAYSLLGSIQNVIGALNQTIIRLTLAILIFLFGFIIGKILGRFIFRALNEVELNSFIRKTTGFKINADHIISNFISYSIYFLSLVSALEQIGIANVTLYFLSAAIIIVILISFFLAIRDFIPNLISGIYLYTNENLRKGTHIEINDIKGEIAQIDLLQVKILTKKGDMIFIPNSVVSKSKFVIKKPKKANDP